MSTENDLVLVVEDSEDQRELLADVLRHEGYRVAVAESGEEALQLIGRECPALVLADLVLPDMNARELLTRIRTLCPTPPPVVVLTGMHPSSTDDIAEKVLLKPVDVDDLLGVVKSYCRLRLQARASEGP